MKKISIFAVLSLSFLLTACDNNSTGVIDTKVIYEESNISKEAFARLQELQAQAAKEIAELEASMDDIKADTSSSVKFGQAEIEAAIKELEKRLQQEQEALTDTVNKAVDEAIEKVKEEINLDEILPKDGTLDQLGEDVTKEVMETLNELEIEIPEIKLDLSNIRDRF